MNTHGTGGTKGTRLGTHMMVHTIPVTFADLTAVAKKLLTIAPIYNPSPGVGVFEPQHFRISAVIREQNNIATTAALAVGVVGAAYTDAIAAFDMKGAVGVNATQAANPIKLAIADTDIFAVPTLGGATGTAGKVDVIIEVWGVNLTEPTNQGS